MPPQRIISLVPSQTELLFDLGLTNEVVGITKFCIYPADKVRDKPIVGGTKNLDFGRIHALNPDLIIANKEENVREQIEELQRNYPVHLTDVNTLPDALAMIREVGALVGKAPEAEAMAATLSSLLSLSYLSSPSSSATGDRSLSVAYFIWRKPWMVAANDTFINSMLHVTGLQNAFAGQSRYPVITPDELQNARPNLVFLSSEPYPFTPKHVAELQAICPSARVILVDGEVFSWYGSRLLRAGDYFRNLHTEIVRQPS